MLIRLTGSGEAAFSCAIAGGPPARGRRYRNRHRPVGRLLCRHEFMRAQRRCVQAGKAVTLQLVVPISITIAALLSGKTVLRVIRKMPYSTRAITGTDQWR